MQKPLILLAILALVASANAEPVRKTSLLPSIEVESETLALSDFLPADAPGPLRAQAAQVMLGRTPQLGTARVLDGVELEHWLRPSLSRRLSVPSRLTVRRTGYRLQEEQIREVVIAALQSQGIDTPITRIDTGSVPLLETREPQLRVLDLWRDTLHHRWYARLVAENEADSIPFLVAASAEQSLPTFHMSSTLQPGRPQPVLKAGQHAVLILTDEGFRVTLPVVCLETGLSGEDILVRDETSNKVFHARITESGDLEVPKGKTGVLGD